MKIRLSKLNEGLNQLHVETSLSKLGVEDQDTISLFPEGMVLDVEVQKLNDQYYVKTNVTTISHFTCDRCLEDYTDNFSVSYKLYYSKLDYQDSESDDYRFLSENADEIDLTDSIIENLLLAVPMKKVCAEDCSGLCPNCGVNLNIEKCDCEKERIDPRWEKLKKLIT